MERRFFTPISVSFNFFNPKISGREQKMTLSILAEGGNKIPEDEVAKITAKDDDTLLTYGNGWCDKNVYKSWNKCAVSGKCYETCTDGNCYDEVRNNGREIQVPRGCNDVYMECAKECSRSRRCKAFTFRNTNVLGNAEFTCMLMDKVLCARSGKFEVTHPSDKKWFRCYR